MLGRKTNTPVSCCCALPPTPASISLLTIPAVPQFSPRRALGGSYKGHQGFRQWLEKLWPPLGPALFLLARVQETEGAREN